MVAQGRRGVKRGVGIAKKRRQGGADVLFEGENVMLLTNGMYGEHRRRRMANCLDESDKVKLKK